MDPASAVGLASSILTFIDFSVKLVSGALEVYRSADGTLEENARLERVIGDFDVVAGELACQASGGTRAERSIRELALECRPDAELLVGLLRSLKVPGKRTLWRSVAAQSEIMLNMVLLLRYVEKIGVELEKVKLDVIKEIQGDSVPQEPGGDEMGSLEDVKTSLRKLQHVTRALPVKQRILRQLIFDELPRRREQIYRADDETCGWVFDTDKLDPETRGDNRSRASQEIVEWLRGSNGVLHISGKAGSGKSTLVRYIAQQQRTMQELATWAGEKPLIKADFYFWNSGSELQRSQQGFFRSLLFEVLRSAPDLIGEVFPGLWSRYQGSWTKESGYKFCFFIDGLDEYEGDIMAQEELALRLVQWAEMDNVKILTAARPHHEYNGILARRDNTIHLHTLNKPDIEAYCKTRFAKDRIACREGKSLDPIVEKISSSAEGIFLWAFLVVNKLLEAMRQGDPLHVVRKKLDETPKELNELYTNLRNSISSPIDRKRCDRMLLLAHHMFVTNRGTVMFISQHVVSFFHRTVKDYLLENEARMRELEASFPHFDEGIIYGNIFTADHLLIRGTVGVDGLENHLSATARDLETLGKAGVPFLDMLRALHDAAFEAAPVERRCKGVQEYEEAVESGVRCVIRYGKEKFHMSSNLILELMMRTNSLSRFVLTTSTTRSRFLPLHGLEDVIGLRSDRPMSFIHFLATNQHYDYVLEQLAADPSRIRAAAGDDLSLLVSAISDPKDLGSDGGDRGFGALLEAEDLDETILVYWIVSDQVGTLDPGFRMPVYLAALLLIVAKCVETTPCDDGLPGRKVTFRTTTIARATDSLLKHARQRGKASLLALRQGKGSGKDPGLVAEILAHCEHRLGLSGLDAFLSRRRTRITRWGNTSGIAWP
ncbi:unnamed protein product [Parascedosporium putredinis]|uniref:NACHT domain-containing protein n=1 Tax=Parascedosporium putredinis TaxID=1442378 RepID=A0A9P1H049_9PEZI|nr:unnamed protein product [Parascedosporium putredinis]CAI7991751.1 unnamed protein product [Parascedosporium putredinis]